MPSKRDDSDWVVPPRRQPAPERARARRTPRDPLAYQPRKHQGGRVAPPARRRGNRHRIPPVKLWNRRLRKLRNLLLFVFVVELVVVALTTPRLRVDTVIVNGATLRSPRQVAQIGGLTRPVNIFQAPVGKAVKRISSLPEVASVRVERKFPTSLSVAVQERKPIASVLHGGAYWVIDPSGVVFRRTGKPVSGRPVLHLRPTAKVALGQRWPSPVLTPMLQCLARIPGLSLGPGVVMSLDGSGRVLLLTGDGLKVRLGPVDRSPERMGVLARLFRGKDGKRLRERALMIDVGTPRGEVWKPRPEWAGARLSDISTGNGST